MRLFLTQFSIIFQYLTDLIMAHETMLNLSSSMPSILFTSSTLTSPHPHHHHHIPITPITTITTTISPSPPSHPQYRHHPLHILSVITTLQYLHSQISSLSALRNCPLGPADALFLSRRTRRGVSSAQLIHWHKWKSMYFTRILFVLLLL